MILLFMSCNQPGQQLTEETRDIKRFGMVIKIKPEKTEEYKTLHANPWLGVLSKIKRM